MAHCVQMSAEEREAMAKAGAGVAHCPLSNAYFAHGVLDVEACIEAGVKVGLGTDIAGGYSVTEDRAPETPFVSILPSPVLLNEV